VGGLAQKKDAKFAKKGFTFILKKVMMTPDAQ
jgi:hypothetical protein